MFEVDVELDSCAEDFLETGFQGVFCAILDVLVVLEELEDE